MHKIIEASETLEGKLALTIEWGDGTETREIVSENAARGLGYHFPDEAAPVDAIGASIEEIETFDRRCSDNEYTDVGEVWEVFHSVLSRLRLADPRSPVMVAA